MARGEAAYGNGFLDRLEHRQQYKLNGFREFDLGKHQLTLFEIGYYGFSYVPGLVPIGMPGLQDTSINAKRTRPTQANSHSMTFGIRIPGSSFSSRVSFEHTTFRSIQTLATA